MSRKKSTKYYIRFADDLCAKAQKAETLDDEIAYLMDASTAYTLGKSPLFAKECHDYAARLAKLPGVSSIWNGCFDQSGQAELLGVLFLAAIVAAGLWLVYVSTGRLPF